MGSVTSVMGMGMGSQKNQQPSQRDFTTIDPFELETFPNLDPHEYLAADQALHYLIISVCLLMEQQQSVTARIFYGLDELCEDEKLLKLVE